MLRIAICDDMDAQLRGMATLSNDAYTVNPPHYLVNMSRVERLDKDGLTRKSGALVPVSGKQLAAVCNTYMSYRLGEV